MSLFLCLQECQFLTDSLLSLSRSCLLDIVLLFFPLVSFLSLSLSLSLSLFLHPSPPPLYPASRLKTAIKAVENL